MAMDFRSISVRIPSIATYIAPNTLRRIGSLSILRRGNSHQTMQNRTHTMSSFAEAALAVQVKPCLRRSPWTLGADNAHALAGRRAS